MHRQIRPGLVYIYILLLKQFMQAKLKSKLSMIMELEQALFSVVRYIHIQTKNNFHVVPVMEESWEQTFLRSAVN